MYDLPDPRPAPAASWSDGGNVRLEDRAVAFLKEKVRDKEWLRTLLALYHESSRTPLRWDGVRDDDVHREERRHWRQQLLEQARKVLQPQEVDELALTLG